MNKYKEKEENKKNNDMIEENKINIIDNDNKQPDAVLDKIINSKSNYLF